MLRITLRKRMILLAVAGVCLTSCSHRLSTFERARTNYMQQNYHNAFRETRDLAYRHDPRGEYALGNMYFYGTGTVKDQDLARYWIKQAAKHGYRPAVVALSIIEKQQYQQYSPLDNVTGHKLIESPSTRVAQVKRERVPTVVVKNTTQAKTTPLRVARFSTEQHHLTTLAKHSVKTQRSQRQKHSPNKKLAVNTRSISKPKHKKVSKTLDLTAPLVQSAPSRPVFEKDITAWGNLEQQQKPRQLKSAVSHKRVATKVVHHRDKPKHSKAVKIAYHQSKGVSHPIKKLVEHKNKKHEVKVARKHWQSDREFVRQASIIKPGIKLAQTKNVIKVKPAKVSSAKKADVDHKDITWALKQNYKNYTVQLSISSKAQKIEKIRQMKIPGCEMVAYRFRDGDKAKYSAVCGSFKKRADAEVILSALPASLKDTAAVYPWGAVQKNMQLY